MWIKRHTITANVIYGCMFVVCVFFSEYKFFSWISVIAFVSYLLYILVKQQAVFIYYFALVFMAVAAVTGVAIIELLPKMYLSELQCTTSYAGSLPLQILSYWLLFATISFHEDCFGIKREKIQITNMAAYSKVIDYITFASLIMYSITLINRLITAPSALSLGIDRFAYAMQYKTYGVFRLFESMLTIVSFFPFLSIAYGNKFLGCVAMSVYILYSIWIGEKFGSLFTVLCIFLIVYYDKIKEKSKKIRKKIVAFALIVFVLVLMYTLFFVTRIGAKNSTEYFMQRSAQQGQLWWKTYDTCKNIHPLEFWDEVEAVVTNKYSISENIGSHNGIYRIMYLCAPKIRVDLKLATGSRYTEAGFASAYYYFGIAGVLFFSVLCGLVFSKTINKFILALNRKDYVRALIFIRFFMIERTMLSMFTFYDLFDAVSIFSYIYLIFMKEKKLVLTSSGKVKIRPLNPRI